MQPDHTFFSFINSIFDHTTLIAMGFVFLGSFVQSTIGFGLAIVAAPLLFLISPDYVPAPVMMMSLTNSIFNAYKYRKNLALGRLKMAICGRIPGSILGGIVLLYVSSSMLSLWLGFMVIMAVFISLFPIKIEPTNTRMGIAGFFSGFMGTSTSIGGPPMALMLQHQDVKSLRGNLAAFFFISSILTLIILSFTGFFSWHHFMLSLPLLPMTWLGYWVAQLVVDFIPKTIIRYLTLIICIVSATTAIIRGLS